MDGFDRTSWLDMVPATARHILAVGPGARAGATHWQARNPHVVIDGMAPGAGSQSSWAGSPRYDAIVLDAATPLPPMPQLAGLLRATGTVALLLSDGDEGEAWARRWIAAEGLVPDRVITPAVPPAPGDGEGPAQPPSDRRVIRARRPGSVPKLHVSAIPLSQNTEDLNGSVVRVRLREPFEQLGTIPGVECRILPDRNMPAPREPDALNLLIWQRIIFGRPNPEFAVRAIRNNTLTVIEIDDHPSFFSELVKDGGWTMFSSFHAIQTSTPDLADYVRQFNPEVGLFGNEAVEVRPLPARPSAPVRIIFAAINRKAGWSEIVAAYRDAVAGYGRSVQTVVIGDREFFNALQPLHSVFMPVLRYEAYRAELEKSHIALLPLADTVFDRSKTDLKFVECAQAGAAVLASPVVYGRSVVDGETGFIYRDVAEFKARLRRLVEEPWTRERLVRGAYAYLKRERVAASTVQKRYEWYLSLFRKRDELNQRLLERVGLSNVVGR